MILNKNHSIRKIGDEYIMIADQESQLDYTQAISLNETAAYLIRESEDLEINAETWAELLERKYDVDHQEALADAQKMIDVLAQAGILK